MKKIVAAAIFSLASVVFAQDTASVAIRNVCDTLANTVINIVPAYIDEFNWTGNTHTGVQASYAYKQHKDFKSLTVSVGSSQIVRVPVSIKAACVENTGTEVEFNKWTNSTKWTQEIDQDYATYIYDIHSLKMAGHDSTNTYNLLAFVEGAIPENYSFKSSQLLFSSTFEFAFEWWFASASYKHQYKDSVNTIHTSVHYGASTSNDSLKAYEAAVNALKVPDSTKSVQVQMLKVVLVDSNKLVAPSSSSSSNPVSCSAEQSSSSQSSSSQSSSSEEESSSSKTESSSSVVPPSSSSEDKSSSSEQPVSCSAEESSSSSEPESSSSGGKSSSSEAESSSSVTPPSSSSEPESSSSAETSSSQKEESSSSSDGPVRIFALDNQDAANRVVQVRRLDGSVVKSSEKLGPGVYYVKYSTGVWQKKAVLAK